MAFNRNGLNQCPHPLCPAVTASQSCNCCLDLEHLCSSPNTNFDAVQAAIMAGDLPRVLDPPNHPLPYPYPTIATNLFVVTTINSVDPTIVSVPATLAMREADYRLRVACASAPTRRFPTFPTDPQVHRGLIIELATFIVSDIVWNLVTPSLEHDRRVTPFNFSVAQDMMIDHRARSMIV